MKDKLYFCENCGRVISVVKDSNAPLMCCGSEMKRMEQAAAAEEQENTGNYIVCKCNNVRYFDILDEIHKHQSIHSLLDMFENVKDTTRCSTGCGGCYNKVISIISDEINR